MKCENCNFHLNDSTNFCPNCGASTLQLGVLSNLPKGNELLNGLYLVQKYLDKINNKLSDFWELERYYRQEQYTQKLQFKKNINTASVKEKSQYGLFVAGVTFSLVFGLIFSFLGDFSVLLYSLVITTIFSIGKIRENKKMLYIGGIFLVMLLWVWLNGLIGSFGGGRYMAAGLGYLFINIIAFGVASIVAAIVLKMYNKRINKRNQEIDEHNKNLEMADHAHNEQVRLHNEQIHKKRQELSDEITILSHEMQEKTGTWYPIDYYVLDCVVKFISIVKNHEADTVKEMLKVYKEDVYRIQVLNHQKEMEIKFEQSLMNQQEMIKLQKISNAVQIANLVANMVTASNTSKIQQDMQDIKTNSYRAANAAENMAQNSKR